MFYFLVSAIIFCMGMSIRTIFVGNKTEKKMSVEMLMWIANLYGTILIGFSLLYLLFELKQYSVILDNGMRIQGGFFKQLETAFYFSAMTMFSVGYGDVSPIGIGRIIAIVQAFIGYTLPAAFILRTVIDIDQQDNEE
ncbi:potassium channel family protein [Peribacillus sp. SCS-155]|uniref:potassium channel family protein n=1 Tax=Peribacillus sedimenti TaxID=3115297 RepID=UPI003905B34E